MFLIGRAEATALLTGRRDRWLRDLTAIC